MLSLANALYAIACLRPQSGLRRLVLCAIAHIVLSRTVQKNVDLDAYISKKWHSMYARMHV